MKSLFLLLSLIFLSLVSSTLASFFSTSDCDSNDVSLGGFGGIEGGGIGDGFGNGFFNQDADELDNSQGWRTIEGHGRDGTDQKKKYYVKSWSRVQSKGYPHDKKEKVLNDQKKWQEDDGLKE